MDVLIISALVVGILVLILALIPKARYKEPHDGIGQVFKK